MSIDGWETYIRKDEFGRLVKDVRPVRDDARGSYAQAKINAVRSEIRKKALADFEKDFARTAALARRKNLDQSGKG